MVSTDVKVCRTCDTLLPLTEFYRSARDGHQSMCKRCKRAYNQANKEAINARERIYTKAWKLRTGRYKPREWKPPKPKVVRPKRVKGETTPRLRKYGLSIADFDAMVERQGGVCAICRGDDPRGLVIDHCHDTGQVRGLLCNRCNTGIGMLRDNAAVVASAGHYLAPTAPPGVTPVMDGRSAAIASSVQSINQPKELHR